MKILLVYTNTYKDLSPPPIGIAYLVPPLKNNGHQIKVLDLMYSKKPYLELDKEINNFKPDVVGYSIRNLDNHIMLSPYNPLPEIKEYIRNAKDKGIKTVIGGSAFTVLPKEMLSYLEADYGITGQGEESLPLLLDMIEKNEINRLIPGLVWKEDGEIHSNSEVVAGYNHKHPDWSSIDIKKYKKSMFPTSVITKTGCQFNCLYCDISQSAAYTIFPREIDIIIKDIREILKSTGTRVIYFADPCLPNPIGFAKELFKAVIKEKLNILIVGNIEPAHGCYDEEFFELFKKAGGIFTILGTESFSPTMLQNYKKPFTMDDVSQWSRLAKKTGLKFGVQLLFGGPGENESTVKETLEAAAGINFSLFMYGIGIRIYPNTELFQIAKSEGIVQSESELLFPKFYVSKDLDVEWARKYIGKAARKYSIRKAGLLQAMGRMMLKKYFK